MRRFTWVLSIETGCCCILGALLFVDLPIHLGSDFGVYYAAAHALRLNPSANIYQWATIRQAAACHPIESPFVYPPFFAILMIPASLLPCDLAFRLWDIVSAACLTGSLILCQSIWPLSRRGFTMLCAATLCSFPLWMGMWYGQIHVLMLFGLLLIVWCLRRGYQFWAGVAVAAITGIMLIPGLFLVYFILRRQWRALAGAAVGGGVATLIMLLVVGWKGVLLWTSNIWIGGLVNRDHPSNLSLVHLLPWMAPIIILAYLVTIVRMRDGEAAAVWTIPTFLLLSPLTWPYFLLWLLPVVRTQWDRGKIAQALCVVAYCAAYVSRSAPLIGMGIIGLFWLAQIWQVYAGRALVLVPRKSLLHTS